MSEKSILVFCEANENGQPKSISLEMLGLARILGEQLGCEVAAVSPKSIAAKVAAYGVDRVHSIDEPPKGGYHPEWHIAFMEEIFNKTNPDVIIFGHTPMGQDVAPRLGVRLSAGMVSDSVGLKVEDGKLIATKQIQGGIGIASYSFENAPNIITVRPGVGAVPDSVEGNKDEVVELSLEEKSAPARWEFIESVCEECGEIKLDEAEIVVSGGRGMEGSEGFALVAELASTLGGAVGSSRPPCDMDWISPSHQVGITGTVISPQVYFAIGISGASQHLSGMCDSKTIIAINKDPDADILKVANYGVVGDFKDVVPAMIDEIKESKKSRD